MAATRHLPNLGKPNSLIIRLCVIFTLITDSIVFAEEHTALWGCTGDQVNITCHRPSLTCRIANLTAMYFHPANGTCPARSQSDQRMDCTTNATDVIHNCANKEQCLFFVRQERQKGNCPNMSQYISISFKCHCSIPIISCPSSNYPIKSYGQLCYELVPEVRSFNESVQVCRSKEGKLADITSFNILNFLREFLDKQYMYGYQWVGNASNILQDTDKNHCYELRKKHGSTWNVSLTACTYRNQFICQYGPVVIPPSSTTPITSMLMTSSVTDGQTSSTEASPWIHIDAVLAMLIAIGVSVFLFVVLMSVICCLRMKDARRFGSATSNGHARQSDMELKICDSSNGSVPQNGVDNLAFEQSFEVPEYSKVNKVRNVNPPPSDQHEYDDVCEDDDSDGCNNVPVALPPRDNTKQNNGSNKPGPNRRHQYENIFIPNIANSLERKFQNVKLRQREKSNKNKTPENNELQIPAVPEHATTSDTNVLDQNIYTNVNLENPTGTPCDEFYYSEDVYNPEDTLGRAQNVDEEGGPTDSTEFVDSEPTLNMPCDVISTYPNDANNTCSDGHDSFEDERKHNPYFFSPLTNNRVMVENDMYNSAEILNITDADLGTI